MNASLHKRLIDVRARERDVARAALAEQQARVEAQGRVLEEHQQCLSDLSARLTHPGALSAFEIQQMADDLARARARVISATEQLEVAREERNARQQAARDAGVNLRVAELAQERAKRELDRRQQRQEQAAADDRAGARTR